MSPTQTTKSNIDPHAMMDAVDIGGRKPTGSTLRTMIAVALLWSLFQLWIASPLPYLVGAEWLLFNSNEARSIHLAFAVFLAFLSYPALRASPRKLVPKKDWLLAIVGALAAAYYFLFYSQISDRVGAPNLQDIVVACIGMVLLLEAARRSLGPALMVVAAVFLIYTFFGRYMPGMLSHRGFGLSQVVNHQWITSEGVFGIALGVSTDFVFLFVLFGALLERAGAGNYFIQLAFSLLGHLRGGPAKAAVVSSGLTGVISGSSIANVVTTGTFTVPLMKRVGFSAEKAGAVEVAASVNGQIMPPVMGAAAFLMVEYVGVSYLEVIKHAFLPALVSYIALVYIVHIEALKMDLKGLPRSQPPRPLLQKLSAFLFGFLAVSSLAAAVYYGLGWLKPALGEQAGYAYAALLLGAYIGLARYSSHAEPLPVSNPANPTLALPRPGPTFKAGLHYLLPVLALVWSLMVERLSPGLSAFWASTFLMFIIVTQKPLFAYFRGEDGFRAHVSAGFVDLREALITGARNMTGIAIATATAGVIVGAVSQTGVGAVLADLVEALSMGSVGLMLVLIAVLCLVLGMGLPTTANYIVVSSLLAGVVVEVGAQNGLIVHLIAVHLFVFYFGLMADVTPPVGLASFAAAAISGGSPIRTGVTAFFYSIRTAALPFLFIFNTDLLLIDVSPAKAVLVFVTATIAMLAFAAATQGYFRVRSRVWETAILLLAAFTLLRPGFWMDLLVEPYQRLEGPVIEQALATSPANAPLRFTLLGEDKFGDERRFVTVFSLPAGDSALTRLEKAGISASQTPDGIEVDRVEIGSLASNAGFDSFQKIVALAVPVEQPPKEWLFIPGLALIALIWSVQRRRLSRSSPDTTGPNQSAKADPLQAIA